MHDSARKFLPGRLIAGAIARLLGWKITGQVPKESRYILIGAPHTSNWDLLYTLLLSLHFSIHLRWIGKKSLFRFPLSVLTRLIGGLPVDRASAGSNQVDMFTRLFRDVDKRVIGIAPEGTRKASSHWHKGFYYIALNASVPVAMGFMDASRKEIGIGPVLYPTGDIESDFAEIRNFYRDKQGLVRENKSVLELKDD